MNNIKKWFNYTLLVGLVMSSLTIFSPMTPVANAACQNTQILSFPMWYKGLKLDNKCRITDFQLNDFWIIVMNGIEILLQIAAYVAAGYILWGGIKFIKSEGDPSMIAEARSAIQNAILGLVVALGSVAIVKFISGGIQGSNNTPGALNLPFAQINNAQVNNIVSMVFALAGAITVLFIIIGAIKYTTSQGNANDVQKGKDIIVYALVGLVFVIFSFTIVQFITANLF